MVTSFDRRGRAADEDARREYEQIWSYLGSRAIKDVIDSPLISDPETLATVDVLTKLAMSGLRTGLRASSGRPAALDRGMPSALFTDLNLLCLTICRAINLSLESGNCDASCLADAAFGRIAGPRFGDYQMGFQFGQLGYELVERRGLKRFQASTYLCFSAFGVRWMSHVRCCRDLVRRAFEAANEKGDLTPATCCAPT